MNGTIVLNEIIFQIFCVDKEWEIF